MPNIMTKRNLEVDNQKYNLSIFKKQVLNSSVPRLIVVSYQPNAQARQILEVCLKSIQKYTPKDNYELWVIDNNSPKENLQWLIDYPNLNVVLNHSQYSTNGSYQNGVALEIAKQVVDQNTQFFMTMHMDTLVCCDGWLDFLLSKFNSKIRAVGVRMDKARTDNGVLHVLGLLCDFQLLKKFKISFLPDLPKHDTGDLVTVKFRENGYQVFACKNTHSDHSLVNKYNDPNFSKINVDRAFNDKNEVFFLHLGRGITKSKNKVKIDNKFSFREWLNLANNFILAETLTPKRLSYKQISPLLKNVSYSIRRYYVDEFYTRHFKNIQKNIDIIDIGGKKVNKRGQFNIENYDVKVKYLNIDPKTNPDFLCNAESIPAADKSFDIVILSEILEHTSNPENILMEAYRVLKDNGKALVTVPFLYHEHPDPHDFSRHTSFYWKQLTKQIGFKKITIENQGSIYGLVANLIKIWANQHFAKNSNFIYKVILGQILYFIIYLLMKADSSSTLSTNDIYRANTTGFGIIFEK